MATEAHHGGAGSGNGSVDLGRLLTAEEVSEIVGLSVEYVWALCRREEIPHIRFGRAKRFRLSAILEWLEHRERAASA